MTASQLLTRWLVMAVLVIITGLLRDKQFSRKLLVVALLSATAIAGLAALHPLTKLPGLLGFGIGWLRLLAIFAIMAAALAGFPLRRSIIMGIGYATIISINNLPR
ncbi:MAG: hypothetical protein M0R49_08980 [Limnochordia bacterium]|nr:hypothetical protein [Limnochordia bacterium]